MNIVEEEEIAFISYEKNFGLVLVVWLAALGLSKHIYEIYILIQIYTYLYTYTYDYVYIWKGA